MLLGRDEEQRELDRVLAAARSGRSELLALVGEAGIGKSVLLDAAEAAAGPMRVLRARGVEAEGAVAFGGLLELLRPALGTLPRIPSPQAAALETALALRPGGRYDRFAVGAATLSLLAAYAEEAPLLVLIDDAQWLDAASGEALLFAFRRLVADPIAVVVAVRDGEGSLLDGADLPARRIGGLGRDAAGALLAGVPAETVDRLHEATAGNPLALLELATDAEAVAPTGPVPVSARIARAFLRRSATLSPGARRSLLLAAASDSGDIALLARAGLAVDDLVEAERLGLVEVRAGTLRFRHPLVRSAVYAEAAPDERRAVHAALADVLPDRDADRRAWHLAAAAAGPDARAAAALEEAARRARDRSAYSVASATFDRAARLEPDEAGRGTLLYHAAEAAWLGGQAERARRLLDEAAAIASDARIDALMGEIATRVGPVMDGFALLVSAAERSAPADSVLMLAEAADACFYAGGAAGPMLDVADRLQRLVDADETAPFYAAVVRGAALVFAGGDGAPDLRRAVELFDRLPLDDDPRTLAWASIGPLFLREAQGRELIARAIATAREHAAIGVLPRLLNRLARDEAATDHWRDAAADFGETIRLARETGQRTELVAALAGLAWLEARQGDDACRAHAAEARTLARELGVGFYELWTYSAVGELELVRGNAAGAVAELEEHETRAAELAFDDVDMSTAPELVDAYLRLGRADDAAAAAARYAERAERKGQPWALARARRSLGLLAGDGFEEHFREALALHAETPDSFETARTHLAYGARLRRSRHRVRAREHLHEALDAFDRLGPTPWADLARAELAATGETARRRDPSTIDDLTPQELQIALLLSGGRTTREAAATLFLSPKTIEYHLRSIYRKLGVNSRDALARAMATR
jgi:DNA-binding CsgD family transcriptional regulator